MTVTYGRDVHLDTGEVTAVVRISARGYTLVAEELPDTTSGRAAARMVAVSIAFAMRCCAEREDRLTL